MAVPFFKIQSIKRSQIIAIDLGAKTTKAIHLQRRGQEFAILNYALQEAPGNGGKLDPEQLGAHLKSVVQSLNTRVKTVVLAAGVADSLLRHAELPMIPVPDMRLMLRFNSKNFLQQELSDHVFDCHLLPLGSGNSAPETKKCRVLVGAARKQYLDQLQAAAKLAGLVADQVVPNLVSGPNAFEMAQPETFQKEVAALVDIGFKFTTISILLNGEIILNRVVGIGGDRLTSGLADNLGISYPEAEGLKVGLTDEIRNVLQSLLLPLGRELRASIDFFEHQQDKTVNQVFVSGGSARSQSIIEMLQLELMAPCRSWDPVSSFRLDLPPEKAGELDQVAPQLAVAAGAALAAF
jgi:type IV pilus assembly protein PilM